MSVHNIYSFYESESFELEFEEMGEIDIETLMMEYQLLQEFNDNTFIGNKDEDAYKYVEEVLDITSLFSIPGVSKDLIMLRIFPITLVGSAK
ncbi:hypothetical protein Tco_0933980 [Tanacetum coccineum]